MFYLITILFVVIGFLIAKYFYNIHEGYINELSQVPSGIPEVPHDTVCLILDLMGAGINKMGSLSNKCAYNNDHLKKDTSNMCMI